MNNLNLLCEDNITTARFILFSKTFSPNNVAYKKKQMFSK